MADLACSAHIIRQNRRSCYRLRRRFSDLPARPQICPSLYDFNHLKNYVVHLCRKYYTSATYVLPVFHIGIHLLKQRLRTLQTLHKLRWEMSITRHIHVGEMSLGCVTLCQVPSIKSRGFPIYKRNNWHSYVLNLWKPKWMRLKLLKIFTKKVELEMDDPHRCCNTNGSPRSNQAHLKCAN